MFMTLIVAVFIALGAEAHLERLHDPAFNPALMLLLTIVVTALAPVPGIILSATVKPEQLTDAYGRTRVLRRVRIGSIACQAYLLISFALVTYLFDWPLLIDGVLGMHGWVLVDELFRLAPFLAMLLLAWVPLYRIDRMLRPGQWSLREYMEFHFRQYVLFILLPFAVMVTVVDVLGLLPGGTVLERTGLDYAAAVVAMAVLYVFSPLALRYVWKTRPLAEGPLRERLHALCERAQMGYRDLLVWETLGGQIVNACVTGLFARVRYVMITDALMDTLSPDEIEGVFAHEIGHVKLHHIAHYVVFAIAFIAVAVLVTSTPLFAGGPGQPTGWWGEAVSPESLALVTLAVLYWGGGFGLLSRRMEMEADLYAAGLTGHAADFVNALERISFYSGRPRNASSWRHFSIAKRTAFLQQCQAEPQTGEHFRAGMSVIRWGIVAFGVVSVAAAAYVLLA